MLVAAGVGVMAQFAILVVYPHTPAELTFPACKVNEDPIGTVGLSMPPEQARGHSCFQQS